MLDLDTSRWERVRFGDVVRNVNESVRDVAEAGIDTIIALEHLDPGEVTVQRYGDAAEGTTFTRRVRPGQTLFGKRRAYQRKAAYAEVDAVCSGDILVFEALPGRLSSRLLPFLVHSEPFFDHAVGTSAGSLSPRTSWKALATFELDLPPLDEQERLADLLWAMVTHSKALRVAHHAASGGRHVYRRIFFQHQAPTSDSSSPWDMTATGPTEPLGELARVRAGATPSRRNSAEFFEGGTIPWVKTLDLNEGTIRQTDEQITQAAADQHSSALRDPETVLVAMYGGYNQIGRTGLLVVRASTNQAVSALTELDPRVTPHYVLEALQAGRSWWRRVAASSRKDPNITKSDVEEFRIPVPPLPAQTELLGSLAVFDLAIANVMSELSQLRSLLSITTSHIWEA